MPTIHEKLKLAYVHDHPDDGLMLSVATAKGGVRYDMKLTPSAAAMLLSQLTEGVKDAIIKMELSQ